MTAWHLMNAPLTAPLWTWVKQKEDDFPNCSSALLLLGLQPFCCCFRDSLNLFSIHDLFPLYKRSIISYFSAIVGYYIPVPLLKIKSSHLLIFFPTAFWQWKLLTATRNILKANSDDWFPHQKTSMSQRIYDFLLTDDSSFPLNTTRLHARKERCIPVNFLSTVPARNIQSTIGKRSLNREQSRCCAQLLLLLPHSWSQRRCKHWPVYFAVNLFSSPSRR